MKYRIVTENEYYYIQKKGFWGWSYIKRWFWDNTEPMPFDTPLEAEDYIKDELSKDRSFKIVKTY